MRVDAFHRDALLRAPRTFQRHGRSFSIAIVYSSGRGELKNKLQISVGARIRGHWRWLRSETEIYG